MAVAAPRRPLLVAVVVALDPASVRVNADAALTLEQAAVANVAISAKDAGKVQGRSNAARNGVNAIALPSTGIAFPTVIATGIACAIESETA